MSPAMGLDKWMPHSKPDVKSQLQAEIDSARRIAADTAAVLRSGLATASVSTSSSQPGISGDPNGRPSNPAAPPVPAHASPRSAKQEKNRERQQRKRQRKAAEAAAAAGAQGHRAPMLRHVGSKRNHLKLQRIPRRSEAEHTSAVHAPAAAETVQQSGCAAPMWAPQHGSGSDASDVEMVDAQEFATAASVDDAASAPDFVPPNRSHLSSLPPDMDVELRPQQPVSVDWAAAAAAQPQAVPAAGGSSSRPDAEAPQDEVIVLGSSSDDDPIAARRTIPAARPGSSRPGGSGGGSASSGTGDGEAAASMAAVPLPCSGQYGLPAVKQEAARRRLAAAVPPNIPGLLRPKAQRPTQGPAGVAAPMLPSASQDPHAHGWPQPPQHPQAAAPPQPATVGMPPMPAKRTKASIARGRAQPEPPHAGAAAERNAAAELTLRQRQEQLRAERLRAQQQRRQQRQPEQQQPPPGVFPSADQPSQQALAEEPEQLPALQPEQQLRQTEAEAFDAALAQAQHAQRPPPQAAEVPEPGISVRPWQPADEPPKWLPYRRRNPNYKNKGLFSAVRQQQAPTAEPPAEPEPQPQPQPEPAEPEQGPPRPRPHRVTSAGPPARSHVQPARVPRAPQMPASLQHSSDGGGAAAAPQPRSHMRPADAGGSAAGSQVVSPAGSQVDPVTLSSGEDSDASRPTNSKFGVQTGGRQTSSMQPQPDAQPQSEPQLQAQPPRQHVAAGCAQPADRQRQPAGGTAAAEGPRSPRKAFRPRVRKEDREVAPPPFAPSPQQTAPRQQAAQQQSQQPSVAPQQRPRPKLKPKLRKPLPPQATASAGAFADIMRGMGAAAPMVSGWSDASPVLPRRSQPAAAAAAGRSAQQPAGAQTATRRSAPKQVQVQPAAAPAAAPRQTRTPVAPPQPAREAAGHATAANSAGAAASPQVLELSSDSEGPAAAAPAPAAAAPAKPTAGASVAAQPAPSLATAPVAHAAAGRGAVTSAVIQAKPPVAPVPAAAATDEGDDDGVAPEFMRGQDREDPAAQTEDHNDPLLSAERRGHRSRAVEAEEWAARQAVIAAQSEEARRLKLQRRAAAEADRRVQGRLDDHRRGEQQRAATATEKEALRAKLCQAIAQRLAGCATLPQILRRLNLPIEGEPHPTQAQLLKAQKKALIKFHPDKYHAASLSVQVEAEEVFKIISEAPLQSRLPAAGSRRRW